MFQFLLKHAFSVNHSTLSRDRSQNPVKSQFVISRFCYIAFSREAAICDFTTIVSREPYFPLRNQTHYQFSSGAADLILSPTSSIIVSSAGSHATLQSSSLVSHLAASASLRISSPLTMLHQKHSIER